MNDQKVLFRLHWEHLAQELNIPKGLSEKIFIKLHIAYNEPWRYYHTVQHIVECLSLAERVRPLLSSSHLVELSIFFS